MVPCERERRKEINRLVLHYGDLARRYYNLLETRFMRECKAHTERTILFNEHFYTYFPQTGKIFDYYGHERSAELFDQELKPGSHCLLHVLYGSMHAIKQQYLYYYCVDGNRNNLTATNIRAVFFHRSERRKIEKRLRSKTNRQKLLDFRPVPRTSPLA